MARPPTPTQRPDWPISECYTCKADAADAPLGKVFDHLGAEHEAFQSAAFDTVIAERMAAQLAIAQSRTNPTASDD